MAPNPIGATDSHIRLAKVFSSTVLLGPPMSNDLISLITHLFTPEEAAIARHLPFVLPKPVRTISRRAGKSVDTVRPLLENMNERRVIFKLRDRYSLLPLLPGMFEYIMIKGRDDEWTRTYAVLFGKLFDSGYMRRYTRFRANLPSIHYVPVNDRVDFNNRIVSDDFLARAIDHHDDIAILNICQCRYHHHLLGEGCEYGADFSYGCIWFGKFANWAVEDGTARRASREEVNQHITRGREKNLVFMTVNTSPESDLMVCLCCRCCCHLLKSVNDFGASSIVASPRYIARVDLSQCNNCGMCADACHTGAQIMEDKTHRFITDKCVGCGVCVETCKVNAIQMADNPAYRPPPKNVKHLAARLTPAAILNVLKTKLYESVSFLNKPDKPDKPA